MENKKEFISAVSIIAKDFSDYYDYNNIYIGQDNTIYINNTGYLSIPLSVIDANRVFLGSDLLLYKSIISLKVKKDIKHLYLELNDDGYHFIHCPEVKEALEMAYFQEIASDLFVISFINKFKNDENEFSIRMNKVLLLYDIKKAFSILQYVVAYKVVKLESIKKILNTYIENLLSFDEKFKEKSNFRYISASVLNLFSLDNIEI